jgi:hypothetical protein
MPEPKFQMYTIVWNFRTHCRLNKAVSPSEFKLQIPQIFSDLNNSNILMQKGPCDFLFSDLLDLQIEEDHPDYLVANFDFEVLHKLVQKASQSFQVPAPPNNYGTTRQELDQFYNKIMDLETKSAEFALDVKRCRDYDREEINRLKDEVANSISKNEQLVQIMEQHGIDRHEAVVFEKIDLHSHQESRPVFEHTPSLSPIYKPDHPLSSAEDIASIPTSFSKKPERWNLFKVFRK